MKKIILSLLIVIASVGLSGCTANNESADQETSIIQNRVEELPEGAAAINGVVRSIEGNEVIVANEIREEKDLTDEEKETQKEERQNLTQEERQASRQVEAETLETESITLIIPVGVTILKTSGTGDSSFVNAELSEIKSGSYISIWMDENNEVEAVKLKGTN